VPWYDIFRFPKLFKQTNGHGSGSVALRHEVEEDVKDHNIRKDHEYGSPGNVFYIDSLPQNEYNPKFMVPQLYDTVQKMRFGDSSIVAALAVMKLPLLRTEVKVIPGKDDTNDAQDILIAKTCEEKLMIAGAVHETWQKQLRNWLLMLDYGFSCAEKVWTQDSDGFLRFSRIAPRLPPSVTEMRVNSDGTLRHVVQNATKNGRQQELKIPVPLYGAVMSWNKEGENHWGQSVLRPIYKHWYYKEELYRIDAVRLDRWGTGIPEAEIAENYNLKVQDMTDLQNMLKRLRGGEQAYLIHPEQVHLRILTPEPGGSTDLGLMNSVYHHDLMIYRSILAHFIATANAEYGNYGSTRTYAEVFFFAEQALANYIEEEYGEFILKPFCDANFNMEGRRYPRLQFADVQKFDMGLLSETLSRLGLAGLITPDDDMEQFLRKTFGWPKLPKDATREVTGIVNPAKPPGSGNPFESDGGQALPGQPKRQSSRRDQKVDQTPVQNKAALAARILKLNEQLMAFIDKEL
jgi:hypothetical protein